MSFDNEGLPVSWEDIKAASRRLVTGRKEDDGKRVAREYLAHMACEDCQVENNIAVLGYN